MNFNGVECAMHTISQAPAKQVPVRRRKKLWEISSNYHCSIIGTCLRRSDLHRLARKKLFRMEAGASTYQIHTSLVSRAGTRNSQSRAMYKLLESRYRIAIKRYAVLKDDEEIQRTWERDLQCGAVAGAYWAIMTHPVITQELRSIIYGQSHMMSHDLFSDYQQDRRLDEELRNKAVLLEEVLVSERLHHRTIRSDLEREIAVLKKSSNDSVALTEVNRELQKRNALLQSELSELSLSRRFDELKQQLTETREHNAGLCGEIDELTRKIASSLDLSRSSSKSFDELKKRNKRLEHEKEELQQENISLEAAVFAKMNTANSCATCKDQDSKRCPGPDLCGKTVLYVGGLHKMIPHYKQLVENHGGQFIHHDGGKEVSRNILPRMLGSADAVLCPVDCVSHDACKCVKKICKRYQKPFVMMRSSGLSSLAKGLSDIVQ